MTDEELIDDVYRQSIIKNSPMEISDWSTWKPWMNSTHQLSEHGQMAYRISTFHDQVINGGIIQYFDNRYGIFAYETLDDLIEIEAKKTWALLSKALLIINPNNFIGERFFEFIYNHKYDGKWEELSEKFRELDNEYCNYDFSQSSESIHLLADYYRKRIT